MAKTEPEIQPGSDEFSRIFSEYHAKIEEITRRTEKRLKSINTDREEAAAEPATTVDQRPESPPLPEAPEETEKEETAPPFLPPSGRVYSTPEPDADRPPTAESTSAIREARRQAKKIVEEAEQKIKKEAKKKTQSEIDRLLEKARKEAEDIVFSARQTAEKEKNEIIAIARHEAEQAVAEITARCRQESQASSSRAITAATEKAQQIMADVIDSGTEINKLIGEMIERAEKTIADFEIRLREDTGDLARVIEETRQRLEEVTAAAHAVQASPVAPALAPAQASPDADVDVDIDIAGPSLAVRLVGERSNGSNGTTFLFRGQVEMKSSSAIDYQYLKSLKKYMVGLPDVKYLQEYASEKETSVSFDILEPLPLLDVLRRVPLVENVVPGAEDDFNIIFKAN
jgi:vacuolar-type H+-ATPase subunit H